MQKIDDTDEPKSVDEVRERYEAFMHNFNNGGGYKGQEVADLGYVLSKLQECSKDAERYRWLKTHHLRLGPDTWIRTGADLDEAIDAELLTKEPAP